MLFNSIEFIFGFLPVTLLLTAVAARKGSARTVRGVLLVASLIFYGWWDPWRLPLLIGTVLTNHALAHVMWARPMLTNACLAAGVIVNIGLLAYFKYRGFLLGDVLGLPGISAASAIEGLPLGISFFTFQQLAWLFDASRAGSERTPLPTYALFVTFFPQLIAGPIVHHNELVPQLTLPTLGRPAFRPIAAGFSLFAIGLFKKVVVADHFAPIADAAFQATSPGQLLACDQAWVGLLSYALQIYFDFSGYSDMALGLGLLFGIVLPVNFSSPYKSIDVAEFWRRWHITLSRFLRDFIYIPLGGNRDGPLRQAANLVVTMILGGLWHGAGYTFLLWGLLHGILLAAAHAHRTAIRSGIRSWPRLGVAAWPLTALTIMLTWVPFRAPSVAATVAMYHSLLEPVVGVLRSPWPSAMNAASEPLRLFAIGNTALATVAAALVFCFCMPSTAELFRSQLHDDGLPVKSPHRLLTALSWRPTSFWASVTAAMFLVAILDLVSAAPSAFLYFQF